MYNNDDIEILDTRNDEDIEILDTRNDDDIEILDTYTKERDTKNKLNKNKLNNIALTLIIISIMIACISVIFLASRKPIYGEYVRANKKEDTITILKNGKCKIKFESTKVEFGDCTWEKEKDEITFKYKIYTPLKPKNMGIPQKMIGTLTGKKLTTDDGAIYIKK